uniref:Hsp70 family protein n=1 Tax=Candidatus Epulonipiscium viviparus TaxID=420336 RepID=UPI00016C0897
MNFYYAIDLGTTNTVIAWGYPTMNKFEAHAIELPVQMPDGSMEEKATISSSVLIQNDKHLVGPYAKSIKPMIPNQVVTSVKSSMGTSAVYSIDNQVYTPEQISSYILQFVLESTAKKVNQEKTDDVIITVPTSSNAQMRNATKQAAQMAGVKIKNENGTNRNILLDEPKAALFHFIHSTNVALSVAKNVLVYDLGGGTLDVSLHTIYKTEDKEIVIHDQAIAENTKIGGDSFDQLIADYFYDKLNLKHIDHIEEKRIMAKLIQIAEAVKFSLTSQYATNIPKNKPIIAEAIHNNIFDNVDLNEHLSLDEYEQIVLPLLAPQCSLYTIADIKNNQPVAYQNIIYPVLDVLIKAEGKVNKIDAVLLSGGMTQFPLIQKRLAQLLGKDTPIIALKNPDLSVALGAVYYHYGLHLGKFNQITLKDTIGLEVMGGKIFTLAKSGAALPYTSPIYDKFVVPEEGISTINLSFYIEDYDHTIKIADRVYNSLELLYQKDKINIQAEINTAGIMVVKIWTNDNVSEKFTCEVSCNTITTASNAHLAAEPELDAPLATESDANSTAAEPEIDATLAAELDAHSTAAEPEIDATLAAELDAYSTATEPEIDAPLATESDAHSTAAEPEIDATLAAELDAYSTAAEPEIDAHLAAELDAYATTASDDQMSSFDPELDDRLAAELDAYATTASDDQMSSFDPELDDRLAAELDAYATTASDDQMSSFDPELDDRLAAELDAYATTASDDQMSPFDPELDDRLAAELDAYATTASDDQMSPFDPELDDRLAAELDAYATTASDDQMSSFDPELDDRLAAELDAYATTASDDQMSSLDPELDDRLAAELDAYATTATDDQMSPFDPELDDRLAAELD